MEFSRLVSRLVRRRLRSRMRAAQEDAPRAEAEHADHRAEKRDQPDQAALGLLGYVERITEDESGPAAEGAADVGVAKYDGADGREQTELRACHPEKQRAGPRTDDTREHDLGHAQLPVGGVKLTRVTGADQAFARPVVANDGAVRDA